MYLQAPPKTGNVSFDTIMQTSFVHKRAKRMEQQQLALEKIRQNPVKWPADALDYFKSLRDE